MSKVLRYSICILLFWSVLWGTAQAMSPQDSTIQVWKDFFTKSYGPDYTLVNGTRHLGNLSSTQSHPYFEADHYLKGTLTISGQAYENLDLKYDLHKQQILLQYEPYPGARDQIILPKEFITAFRLQDKVFCKKTFSQTGTSFFQVISAGKIGCLIYWSKNLISDPTTSQPYLKFSQARRQIYIILDEHAHPVRSRGSFMKFFSEADQKKILKYLRTNHLWFQKISDTELGNLIEFCNNEIISR